MYRYCSLVNKALKQAIMKGSVMETHSNPCTSVHEQFPNITKADITCEARCGTMYVKLLQLIAYDITSDGILRLCASWDV